VRLGGNSGDIDDERGTLVGNSATTGGDEIRKNTAQQGAGSDSWCDVTDVREPERDLRTRRLRVGYRSIKPGANFCWRVRSSAQLVRTEHVV
jgi:hypothetical protein